MTEDGRGGGPVSDVPPGGLLIVLADPDRLLTIRILNVGGEWDDSPRPLPSLVANSNQR